MVLSRVAAAAGLTRWNSSSTMTFWSPSAGLRLARRTISRAASIGIAAPVRSTMWRSGCCSASASRRWRSASSSLAPAANSSAANARAAERPPAPEGPTKSLACTGCLTAARSAATAAGWPTTVDQASASAIWAGAVTATHRAIPPSRSAQLQALPGHRGDRRRQRVALPVAVEHDPPTGVALGHGPEAGPHPLVEGAPRRLEPVEWPGEALRGDVGRHLEQHDQVRQQAVARPPRQVADLGRRQPAAVALVGDRGVQEAVGHDVAAGVQRGPDDLLDVLGARCGEEQRLGPLADREPVGREDEVAQVLAETRAPGLTGEQRVDALRE